MQSGFDRHSERMYINYTKLTHGWYDRLEFRDMLTKGMQFFNIDWTVEATWRYGVGFEWDLLSAS